MRRSNVPGRLVRLVNGAKVCQDRGQQPLVEFLDPLSHSMLCQFPSPGRGLILIVAVAAGTHFACGAANHYWRLHCSGLLLPLLRQRLLLRHVPPAADMGISFILSVHAASN